MFAALIWRRPILMHLYSPSFASWKVVGALRLANKHHHDARTFAQIGAEEKNSAAPRPSPPVATTKSSSSVHGKARVTAWVNLL